MTSIEHVSIFDEIVNCGIQEEDSVVNFGAGYENGGFLKTLYEYNGILDPTKIIAIEPDSDKIQILKSTLPEEQLNIILTSLQEYVDMAPSSRDWSVITGIFDTHLYDTRQHEYVTTVVKTVLEISNKGIVFTIKETLTDKFKYSMLYFFAEFSNSYDRLIVRKVTEGDYVFCIFKQ